MKHAPLRIAIAGLGTVGGGTLGILREKAGLLAARSGRPLVIQAVSARDQAKARGHSLDGIKWESDPLAFASDPEIDVVVELIGGAEGTARALVEASLTTGKHVVTANKALIAHHGLELARRAEKAGVTFAFEAAVAGGIPIVKGLREGLAANEFRRIAGILNGTCNFILSAMSDSGADFAEALKDAQAAGFAEADPTFDVEGIDTAHKLAILTSLAYGCPPAIGDVHVEGITKITARDIAFAEELGYGIKLLGLSSREETGILQRVHPCLVPKNSPIGRVRGGYNAVIVEGDPVGRVTFEGPGAGAGATASSVVGDLMDIARGVTYPPFTLPVAALTEPVHAAMETLKTSYYVRLSVKDEPGVLAAVTGLFRDEGISLDSFLQRAPKPSETVQLVLTTHETTERAMMRALSAIGHLNAVLETPQRIRIEAL